MNLLYKLLNRAGLLAPVSFFGASFMMFAPAGGNNKYSIANSVRFRSSANAYLSRTFGTPTNNKIYTFSCFVKRGTLGVSQNLIGTSDNNLSSGNVSLLRFDSSDKLSFVDYASAYQIWLLTTQVFRDPSAWYHIVLSVDTTQVTAANRVKLYVNGAQVSSFDTATYPSQNYNPYVNSAVAHYIASANNVSTGRFNYLDGYLSDAYFIDGQALTPSSFGQFNSDGVWTPKQYTGTYGTNGFYLKFNDGSNLTNLCLDRSGNGNNWTASGVSLTAGVTYDWMVDTPTNNYATLNPLTPDSGGTYSNANLKFLGTPNGRISKGTIQIPSSGKWAFAVRVTNAPFTPRGASSSYNSFGFISTSIQAIAGTVNTARSNSVIFGDNGYLWNYSTTGSDSGYTISSGDSIEVLIDRDANTFSFKRSGVTLVSGTIGIASGSDLTPVIVSYDGSYGVMEFDFGQQGYTPPSGFKALCTSNLPAAPVPNGRKHFDVVLWSGTNVQQNITGLQFKPDSIWSKIRNQAYNHKWADSVRGVLLDLYTNSTSAEVNQPNGLVSFNSDGFTVGSDSAWNYTTGAFAAWCWKAGGAAVSNTAGSITSQVSANTNAGFSIVTYTGNGTNPGATIGHGLGVAPSMIITKSRSGTGEWPSYHKSVGVTNTVYLNATYASSTYLNRFSAVSSTTFTTGSSGSELNTNGTTYVAYCFAEVPGFSKFGSYTGNGSSDGPFVYCGFRPRWILIKRIDASVNWMIVDTARNTVNLVNLGLYPDLGFAEQVETANVFDIVSNGFKVRGTGTGTNASGGTYIFAAFAENPFGGSNVAPATAR